MKILNSSSFLEEEQR